MEIFLQVDPCVVNDVEDVNNAGEQALTSAVSWIFFDRYRLQIILWLINRLSPCF